MKVKIDKASKDRFYLFMLIGLREIKSDLIRIKLLESITSTDRYHMLSILAELFADGTGMFIDIVSEHSYHSARDFNNTIKQIDKKMLQEMYNQLK